MDDLDSEDSQSFPDSCHTEDVIEKGHLNVKVKKVKIFRSNSAVESGMPTYQMSSMPRGQALIIEIEQYENDIQDKRVGSQYDVTNLKELFNGLGFEVEVHCNLKKKEFVKQLSNFARNIKHNVGDMMILAILSHGRDGQIYAADGSIIATEEIYEMFNNVHCPYLKGKPKFFIIQACRGGETDKAFDIPHAKGDALPAGRKRPMIGSDMDTTAWNMYREIDRARPTWEDMIIAYSTIPGFASIRDHDKGTWFVQSLVEVFSNHAHDRELIDLLRMTSQRLSQFTNDFHEKQTCNVELRHLYKRIYFNPGYYSNGGSINSPLRTRKVMRRRLTLPPTSCALIPAATFDDEYHNDSNDSLT